MRQSGDVPYKRWVVFVMFDRARGDDKDGWRMVGGTQGGPATAEDVIRRTLRTHDLGQRWAFALELKAGPIYGLYYPDDQDTTATGRPITPPHHGVYEQVVS